MYGRGSTGISSSTGNTYGIGSTGSINNTGGGDSNGLVVRSNSANARRASRLFLQKNRTEITSNCSAQCNTFHSELASEDLKSLIPD